jgi:hypothetical protein
VRIMVIALAALTLGGCATAPTVAREGNLAVLRGQSLAPLSGASAPTDAALAAAIQAGVLKRLAANGADVSGARPAAYLLQVGVGVSASAVGVSNMAGPTIKETAWRSAPTRLYFWSRRGPAHSATAVVLDVATGKPVAWATVRDGRADADALAERLVQALSAPAS